MKIIDRIVEAIGLVEEEEYDEEEFEQEGTDGQKPREPFFRPKADLIAKERAAREAAAKEAAAKEEAAKRAKEEQRLKEEAAKEEAARKEAERREQAARKEAERREQAARKEAAAKEAKQEKRSFFAFGSKGPRTEMTDRTIDLPIDNKPVQVVVLEPVSFDDSQKVADFLRGSRPVIINFEGTDAMIAKRMTDFISGTIYALNGSMKKIGRSILVCAPRNVKIDADLPAAESEEGQSDNVWKK